MGGNSIFTSLNISNFQGMRLFSIINSVFNFAKQSNDSTAFVVIKYGCFAELLAIIFSVVELLLEQAQRTHRPFPSLDERNRGSGTSTKLEDATQNEELQYQKTDPT